MTSETSSISLRGVGKMYKLFDNRQAKVLDALGVARVLPRRMSTWQPYWALRGIDLEVRRGERVGIIGRNGAGKSTLLKMICSNLVPTEGTINVRGKIQALLEMGTGFHPEFTGRENIRASLAYNGLTPGQIAEREEEIAEFAELEAFIDQPLKTYSAGMYARLAFSTATAIEPEILIIDEVLGAGDAYFTAKCLERMRKLTHDAGATVLFVSHDLGSVQAMCDRAIWIDRGRVTMDGTPLEVSRSYYKQVQERENQRRLANAQGVSRAEAQSRSDQHLFRLRTMDALDPRQVNAVRSIKIERGNTVLQTLDVGGPMDNDREHDFHVYTAKGFMNWSDPVQTERGLHREFRNVGGRYHHAPFQLRMANPAWSDLTLRIEADCAEAVFIDMFVAGEYLTLAQLAIGEGVTVIDLAPVKAALARAAAIAAERDRKSEPKDAPARDASTSKVERDAVDPDVGTAGAASVAPSADVRPATSAVAKNTPASAASAAVEVHAPVQTAPAASVAPKSRSVVTWKDPDPKITNVEFLDRSGTAVGGIEFGSNLTVRMHYAASKRIVQPVFAFTFYLPDGRHLVHANNKLGKVDVPFIEGEGYVDFVFSPFPAGPCDLVLSCSIFEYLDPQTFRVSPPFYDQHDRAYELKIWQAIETGMNPGLINATYEVQHRRKTTAKVS